MIDTYEPDLDVEEEDDVWEDTDKAHDEDADPYPGGTTDGIGDEDHDEEF